MPRYESDREDLLREATALVERAELKLRDYPEPIVIGFRRDGSGSVYVGTDPAWQFNTRGELRRAYVSGRLIKAEEGRLVALTRERSEEAVNLVRHRLGEAETAELLANCREWLQRLEVAIAASEYELEGQVPADGEIVPRIQQWLMTFAVEIQVARRPNVG